MKLTEAKVLRVNLSDKKIAVEEVDQNLLKLYFGGRGLASKMLADEIDTLISNPQDLRRSA